MVAVNVILDDIVDANCDRVFLVDAESGTTTTYAQLHHASHRVAGYLYGRGVRQGDCVAFAMNNSIELAQLYFGCLLAGAVAVPVNPVLGRRFLRHVVEHCRPALVFSADSFTAPLGDDALPVRSVRLGRDVSFAADIIDATGTPAKNVVRDTSASLPALMTYTSGTTAQPKPVMHSLENLFGNGSCFARRMQLTSSNRFYNLLPMTYLGGYYNLLLIPFISGSSVVVGREFSAQEAISFWNPVIRHRVNTLWLVPTILSILLELDRGNVGVDYCRHGIQCCMVGTAPLPSALREAFEARYQLRLLENYGLSETLFLATTLPGSPATRGVGLPLDFVQIRIATEETSSASDMKEGVIWVTTPHMEIDHRSLGRHVFVSSGRRATSEWYDTGDLGVVDSEGVLHVTGRQKDIIIRGGTNVAPSAIEDVFAAHPEVRECVVVGVPDRITGETIAAVIRVSAGTDFDCIVKELTGMARDRLAPVQRPAHYLQTSSVPRTASGKVVKAEVRQWASALIAGQRRPGPAPAN
jgi:acyl-CoA synthetase (AMP-forming)/AMP-acid ligase II